MPNDAIPGRDAPNYFNVGLDQNKIVVGANSSFSGALNPFGTSGFTFQEDEDCFTFYLTQTTTVTFAFNSSDTLVRANFDWISAGRMTTLTAGQSYTQTLYAGEYQIGVVGGNQQGMNSVSYSISLSSGSQEVIPKYIMQVGRLYEAGLARLFDTDGLNYWIDRSEAGMNLLQLAQLFLDSPEFTSKFGDDDTMSSVQFLHTMYQNALGRSADVPGLQYWLGQMQNGMSREMILLQFSESPENVAQSSYLNSLHQSAPGYWTL